MLHANSLPPETLDILNRIAQHPASKGFTLIGGTALALRHGHRTSWDVDLAWTQGDLPLGATRELVDDIPRAGPATNLISRLDQELAENDGTYLGAHQQDWNFDGVKVTFFAPDVQDAGMIADGEADEIGELRHAGDETLFRLKSALPLQRTNSRDLFDLWWFVTHGGRTTAQILAVMRERDRHQTVDMHLARLAPSRFPTQDPGFATTLPGAPADPEHLSIQMQILVDEHRRVLARDATLQAEMARRSRGY